MVEPNRPPASSKMLLAPIHGLSEITDDTCEKLRTRFRALGFVPSLVAEADAFCPGVLRQPRLDVLERERLRLSPHVRVTREAPDAPNAPSAMDGRAVVHVVPPGIGTDWPVAEGELRALAAIDTAASVGAALDEITRAAPSLAGLRDELLSFVRSALLRGALAR